MNQKISTKTGFAIVIVFSLALVALVYWAAKKNDRTLENLDSQTRVARSVAKNIPAKSGESEKEKACLGSGGKIISGNCCKITGDFPNSCAIGACGCAPANSHQVKTCDCGEDKCFDGNVCVKRNKSPAL